MADVLEEKDLKLLERPLQQIQIVLLKVCIFNYDQEYATAHEQLYLQL